MKFKKISLSVLSMFALATGADAITYDIDRTIGAGSVSGFIETDGTFGDLGSADIVDFALTVTSPSLAGGPSTSFELSNSTFRVEAGVTASSTALMFDFDASGAALVFQDNVSSNGWCMVGTGFICTFGSSESNESIIFSLFSGAAESVNRSGVVTLGTVAPVPLPAALPLALVGAGVFGAMARRKKKKHVK